MKKIHIETSVIRESGNDLMAFSKELTNIFNQIFDRLNNMPSRTGEWTGDKAIEYAKQSMVDKVQYTNFIKDFYNRGQYLVDYANKMEILLTGSTTSRLIFDYDEKGFIVNAKTEMETAKSKVNSALDVFNYISVPDDFIYKNGLFDCRNEIENVRNNINNDINWVENINNNINSIENECERKVHDFPVSTIIDKKIMIN